MRNFAAAIKISQTNKNMSEKQETIRIADTTANPGPLGLAGFGMTTLLLNLHNAGLFPLDSMILAMGLFFGGAAQVIAGCMEWKKNNLFGQVAFTSYGFFWIILVFTWMLPDMGVTKGIAPTPTSFSAFLAVWGVFTVGLFVASLTHGKLTAILFGLVAVLFFALAAQSHIFAGWVGIAAGALALYLSLAAVINDSHKKKLMPVF